MAEYVKFFEYGNGYPQNLGWYYTKYNEDTGEGEGFFGTPEAPQYMFIDTIERDELGLEVLVERVCGYGASDIWSEPRTVEIIDENPFAGIVPILSSDLAF